MSFVLSSEREEFRDTLRRFFAESSPSTEVRRLMDTDRGFDDGVWKQMAEEIGLQGVVIPEASGGQGLSFAELALALGEMGRVLHPSPFLGSVVLAGRAVAHAASEAEGSELLPAIAAGELATLAIAEPDVGRWDARGISLEATPAGDGVRLSGSKSFVLDGHTAARLLVVARTPGSRGEEGIGLYLVEGNATGLSRSRLDTLDATRRLARVELDAVEARPLGDPGNAWPALEHALCEASVALCAEMLGGMEHVLETSVEYARTRHQFGRAIGSFQAVKHMCADLLIGLEGARAAVDVAVDAVVENDPELPLLASIARAHCNEAYYRAARDNIQIHGGLGATYEFDAHLYLRRAKSSQQILGDTSFHRELIATELDRATA